MVDAQKNTEIYVVQEKDAPRYFIGGTNDIENRLLSLEQATGKKVKVVYEYKFWQAANPSEAVNLAKNEIKSYLCNGLKVPPPTENWFTIPEEKFESAFYNFYSICALHDVDQVTELTKRIKELETRVAAMERPVYGQRN